MAHAAIQRLRVELYDGYASAYRGFLKCCEFNLASYHGPVGVRGTEEIKVGP